MKPAHLSENDAKAVEENFAPKMKVRTHLYLFPRLLVEPRYVIWWIPRPIHVERKGLFSRSIIFIKFPPALLPMQITCEKFGRKQVYLFSGAAPLA